MAVGYAVKTQPIATGLIAIFLMGFDAFGGRHRGQRG